MEEATSASHSVVRFDCFALRNVSHLWVALSSYHNDAEHCGSFSSFNSADAKVCFMVIIITIIAVAAAFLRSLLLFSYCVVFLSFNFSYPPLYRCNANVCLLLILPCSILQCTVLYCSVLHWTKLYITLLLYIVLHCTALYHTVLCSTALYHTILH